jgi:hypothetical protein
LTTIPGIKTTITADQATNNKQRGVAVSAVIGVPIARIVVNPHSTGKKDPRRSASSA